MNTIILFQKASFCMLSKQREYKNIIIQNK